MRLMLLFPLLLFLPILAGALISQDLPDYEVTGENEWNKDAFQDMVVSVSPHVVLTGVRRLLPNEDRLSSSVSLLSPDQPPEIFPL